MKTFKTITGFLLEWSTILMMVTLFGLIIYDRATGMRDLKQRCESGASVVLDGVAYQCLPVNRIFHKEQKPWI